MSIFQLHIIQQSAF